MHGIFNFPNNTHSIGASPTMFTAFRASAGAAALLAIIGMSVPAMSADNAAAIQARQDLMKSNGAANAALKKVIDAGGTDKAELTKQAAVLAATGAKNVDELFPAGSGAAAGKTRAKDDIWSMSADFKASWASFAKATADLSKAAAAGDLAAIKTAYDETGKTCAACHGKFRGPAS